MKKEFRHSFLEGIASIFDFNPDFSTIYDKIKTPEEHLRENWKQVGTYIQEAMNQFEQEQEITNSKTE